MGWVWVRAVHRIRLRFQLQTWHIKLWNVAQYSASRLYCSTKFLPLWTGNKVHNIPYTEPVTDIRANVTWTGRLRRTLNVYCRHYRQVQLIATCTVSLVTAYCFATLSSLLTYSPKHKYLSDFWAYFEYSILMTQICHVHYLAGWGRTALPGGLTKRRGDSADIMHSKTPTLT